jgi:hypothetical protein
MILRLVHNTQQLPAMDVVCKQRLASNLTIMFFVFLGYFQGVEVGCDWDVLEQQASTLG